MTRVRRAFRAGFLLLLVVWPIAHMALSARGAFSSWRFAGWGMYATPYPSADQHPIEVVVSLPGQTSGPARSLGVSVASSEVSRVLADRDGVFFTAHCAPCLLSTLAFSSEGARQLIRLAHRARHLRRQSALDALAGVVEQELLRAGFERFSLRLRFGTRFARPLSNQYGVTHEESVYPAPG